LTEPADTTTDAPTLDAPTLTEPGGAPGICCHPGYKPYLSTLSFYCLALLASICHHFFYANLDGKPPDSLLIPQTWAIRAGNALAYIFQMCLILAISTAFSQQAWRSVRRTALSVNGLDAMFGALGSLWKLRNTEFLIKTKTLAVMALLSWLMPLSAILSPGALTVIDVTYTSFGRLLPVPILAPLDSYVGLYDYETTVSNPGGMDVQDPRVAIPTSRLALRVFTSGEMVPWPSPCGANCSYSITFNAPAFDCASVGANESHPEFNLPDKRQSSTLVYTTTQGPSDLEELWFLYGSRAPQTWAGWLPTNMARCTLHVATYDIYVQYKQNLPIVNTTVHLHEILNKTVVDNKWKSRGEMGSPLFEYNYTSGPEMVLVNYYTIEQSVAKLLVGTLNFGVPATSQIAMSTLIETMTDNATFPDDFPKKIEQLLINTTLSMISFFYNPINASAPVALLTRVHADVTDDLTQYAYSPSTLWLIYGVALGASALVIIIGAYMLFLNGTDAEMSFSQFLVTTRNPTLDRLCQGSSLGGEHISKDLLKTKLIFGEVPGGDEPHAGFGVEEEVLPLKKR